MLSKHMNILLINPWIYDFAAFDLWAKPLGLLYIGSFLESYGYDVRLIDCLDRHHPAIKDKVKRKKYATGKFFSEEVSKPLLVKDIPRKFKKYGIPTDIFIDDLTMGKKPNLVVITSMMTYWYQGVCDVIGQIKKIFPDVPIILGGMYATLCTDHAHKHSGADYIITGDGKIGVLKIADSLSGQSHAYQKLRTDLDTLPPPAYHLYKTIDSVSMVTSLGCPYNCTYCASRFIQPRFIERNPDAIFKEILYYHKTFSIEDIALYDDALLIHAATRFIPLAEKIIHDKLPIRFHTPNGLTIRSINQHIANLLYHAGFKTIRLSFESATARIQRDSSMKTTNEELKAGQKYLRQAGYHNSEIEIYVMVGLPSQIRQEIIDTISFVHDLGLKIKLVQYSPIPHTIDYNRVLNQYPFVGTDPLFHNNSVYSIKTNEIGYSNLMGIKDRVVELNRKL